VPLPEKDSDCDTIRVFFNEIHPSGWEKSSSLMKSPAGMKSGSTPDGWISFHLNEVKISSAPADFILA